MVGASRFGMLSKASSTPGSTFLFHRRWLWLPLTLILALTSSCRMGGHPDVGIRRFRGVAIFAAGLLTRDGGDWSVTFSDRFAVCFVPSGCLELWLQRLDQLAWAQ